MGEGFRRRASGVRTGGVAAGIVFAAVSLGGCSSSSFSTSGLSNLFGASAPPAAAAGPMAAASPLDDASCPNVEIRPGAGSLAVHTTAKDEDVNTLRYQLSFGQLARDCSVAGGTMTMRVGVVLRVVLGPAGAPGSLVAPVRFAVVREGPEPKPIMTVFHPVQVSVADGTGNVPVPYVANDVVFPVPPGDELDSYVVYVGYDAESLKGTPRSAAKRKKR